MCLVLYLEVVGQLCVQAIVIDSVSIFVAVPACRLLVSGGKTAQSHASRPVLAEHVFASHFRIDAKAICGVVTIVCASVAKAQQQIPDEALVGLVGHFVTRTDKIVHDHFVDVVGAVSWDFQLGSAAHAINGEADIKGTAGVLQFPQMGVLHGHVEAGRCPQFIAVVRKKFVAEP